MKKYTLLALSLATIIGLVGLSSCSKDDPAPRLTVSFARATQSFSEGIGVAEVEVVLDQAAGEDITVDFDIDGTALEGAASTANSDYEITSGSGEVKIKKGQTIGVIELKIKNDTNFEGDETIELEITNVSSTGVDISEDNSTVITISEDDPQPVISFTTATQRVNEDDGLLEVEITIDRPAPQDITVTYVAENQDTWQSEAVAVSADYADQFENFPGLYVDYFAIDDENQRIPMGEVTIPQGETTAKIRFVVYTEFSFDDDEVIDLTLTGATGGAAIATASTKKKTAITIDQQDGKLVLLTWSSIAANLNMYLFAGEDVSDFDVITNESPAVSFSTFLQEAGDDPRTALEYVFVPSIWSEIDPDWDTYGVSVVYKTGTVDPLLFTLDYIDFVDDELGDEATDSFDGIYHADNVNDFPTTSNVFPKVIQTFELKAGDVKNYSELSIPETGSRKKFDKTRLTAVVSAGKRKINLNAVPSSMMKGTTTRRFVNNFKVK